MYATAYVSGYIPLLRKRDSSQVLTEIFSRETCVQCAISLRAARKIYTLPVTYSSARAKNHASCQKIARRRYAAQQGHADIA